MNQKNETQEQFIKRKNLAFRKNAIIKVKDIGRKGWHYLIREAWTFMGQSNLSNKVFIIERLRKELVKGKLSYDNWHKGEIEYRIGYYIVGKIGRANGRWIWGQFCPLIPAEDFTKLINKAKQEGTIRKDN